MAVSSIPPATPPANHLGGATTSTPRSRRARISAATSFAAVDLKTKNPKLPIMIRECFGVEPQIWARYGYEEGIHRNSCW